MSSSSDANTLPANAQPADGEPTTAHAIVNIQPDDSEAWFRSYIENSADAFLARDANGIVTFVNDAACRLVECAREEIIGKPATMFLADPDPRQVFAEQLRRDGVLSGNYLQVRTKRGVEKTVQYSTRLVKDREGNVVGTQIISRDVTKHQVLLKTLQHRNEELDALNAIAEILSHPLEIKQTLHQVCAQLATITRMETVTLYLIDGSNQFARLVSQHGISDPFLSQVEILGFDDPATHHVFCEGKTIGMDDVSQYTGTSFDGPRQAGYHAGIGVPILQHHKPIGAIFVGSQTLSHYEKTDVDLLLNVGRQIGTALENSDLYTTMQERVQELDGLAQLSAACASTFELDEICKTVIHRTCDMMHVELCTIRLVEGDDLILAASYPNTEHSPFDKSLPLVPRLRQTIERSGPLVVNDLRADREMPEADRDRVLQGGWLATMVMPMVSHNHGVGILTVLQSQPHVWNPSEIDLLKTIANQASNAIENAQLFQHVSSEQRKVQAIFDSGLSGLYATDAQGHIVMFNHVAERITGWNARDVFDKTWNEIFTHPDPQEHIKPLIDEALIRKQTAFVMDGRQIFTRDGRTIFVSEAVAPLLNEQKEIIGAVGAFWDLTREKQAEISQREILTQVAHQLRSPLTAVLSALEMLDKSRLTQARRKEMWQVIRRDAERLRVFANEFLDHQAILQSDRPLRLEPLSIAVVVRDLVERLQTFAPTHTFQIDCVTPEPIVLADASAVQDVLRNLLDNAVHYSDPGTTITTTIEPSDDSMIEVSVRDQGPGIKLEDLDHVFRPFFRSLNSQGQRAQYSHGLGLSIAKRAVEQMGGKIWIHPDTQKGTRIHFTLRRSA